MGFFGSGTTVMSKVLPLGIGVLKVNAPSACRRMSSPPLFRTTTTLPLARPDSAPPTENALVLQSTTTLVTGAFATTPEPLVTVHVWEIGALGVVKTVTEYPAPLAIGVAKANDPLVVTERSSPL